MTSEPRPQDGDSYLWWRQGLRDESAARDEGMPAEARELRDVVEALGRLHKGQTGTANAGSMIIAMARIYAPQILRRRYRR